MQEITVLGKNKNQPHSIIQLRRTEKLQQQQSDLWKDVATDAHTYTRMTWKVLWLAYTETSTDFHDFFF